jgi:hypothetical protein
VGLLGFLCSAVQCTCTIPAAGAVCSCRVTALWMLLGLLCYIAWPIDARLSKRHSIQAAAGGQAAQLSKCGFLQHSKHAVADLWHPAPATCC